ncbi:MAG: hypothetical protein Q4Q58_00045 [Thermoplasmata archaeon]|nr:hypothetical protein [Thermoplasmata archaeon]
MSEGVFGSVQAMLGEYPHIGSLRDNPHRDERFRVFPIMDVDGDSRSFGPYRTGNMFSGNPLAKYIVPIYNDPNLDSVMEEIGYGTVSGKKVMSYSEILDRMNDPLDFYRSLEACDSTNMDEFVHHILSRVPGYQSKLPAPRSKD